MYLEGLKIDAISDTHTKHKKVKLPGGDILLHSGDATFRGELSEMLEFFNWLGDQDYSHIIYVPGNHDFLAEENPALCLEECEKRGITLLNDSGCEVEGIKIWGSAITPWFHDWAFNRERGDEITKHWELIPKDTEILITHGPPFKILDNASKRGYDNHVGCYDLDRIIRTTQVKLHVFGHIHEDAGYRYYDGRLYVNASSLDGMYCFNAPGYTRIVKGVDEQYLVESEPIDTESDS